MRTKNESGTLRIIRADRGAAGALSLAEAPTLRFHRVEPGDTLVGLAQRLYGDESFRLVLFDANREVLGESLELTPGVTLYLPFL